MNDDAEIERQAANARLCECVVNAWKARWNTAEIAAAYKVSEPVVCRVLSTWRDLRWQMTQQRRARA